MDEATKGTINTPRTMVVCVESMGLMKAMAENGLKASVSDAGVGALCARTGAIGAYLNVGSIAWDWMMSNSRPRRSRKRKI